MRNDKLHGTRGRGRLARYAAVAFLVAGMGACDSLLEVELPGNLTEDNLLTPVMAATMVVSAIADFECGYTDFAVTLGGLEDAYWESTGWFTRAWAEYRILSTSGNCGTSNQNASFATTFQLSRFAAEQAYAQITEWTAEEVTDREELLGTSAMYTGFIYGLFGEHWCRNAVDLGPELSQAQMLTMSEGWFDVALSHMGTDYDLGSITTSAKQTAYLGRARVRFAQGDYVGAAQDAALVNPGFVAYVTRENSVRKRFNSVYQHLNENKYGSITPPVQFWDNATSGPAGDPGPIVAPGFRNLTIAADGTHTQNPGTDMLDHRVPVEDTGQIGQDGVTPHWVQLKYVNQDADIMFAKWAEAQLILAEIDIINSDEPAAILKINALRLSYPVPLPTVTAVDLAFIIEERRREFFLEGIYHADKLRYGLWFPQDAGFNHKGVAYGPTTCLPIDDDEITLNPNVS